MLLIGRLIKVSLDFQTDIGAAAHVTLEMEKLVSHRKAATVDTTTTLQDSDGEVIPFSEVHD